LSERERQINALRSFEADLHRLEVRETSLANQMREKEMLEERIETMKREITTISAEIKVTL
jgi:DNA repair protein RAD50